MELERVTLQEIFVNVYALLSLLVLVCIHRRRAIYRRESAYFSPSSRRMPDTAACRKRKASREAKGKTMCERYRKRERGDGRDVYVGLRKASLRSLGPESRHVRNEIISVQYGYTRENMVTYYLPRTVKLTKCT